MKLLRTLLARLIYFLENFIFSELYLARFLRLCFLAALMVLSALICVYMFESPGSIRQWVLKTPPYLLAPFSAVITAILVGARYVQDIYELPGYGIALRYLLASLFDGPPYLFPFSGWFLPYLSVSNGQKSQNESVSLLDRVGGPGWLTVAPGNVALLENLQNPTMVLGAGFHFIPRFMRVQEVFSLEDQHWKADGPIVATTKDGIQVAVHDFQFTYRLCSSNHSSGIRTLADPYPFSQKAVRDLAYNRAVRGDGTLASWGFAMQFRIDGTITDFVNKHTVDQVLAPTSVDPRTHMMSEMNSGKLRAQLKSMLGSELLWANIGRFDLYDEQVRAQIKKYRMDSWFEQWAGGAALIKAQGKAEQISQEEGGRSESTATMLKSITQALEDAQPTGEVDDHLWNIVLARTAQVIEAMTSVYDMELPALQKTMDGESHE